MYNQSLSIKLKVPLDLFRFVFLGPGRHKILFAILNPSYYLTVLIPYQYKNVKTNLKHTYLTLLHHHLKLDFIKHKKNF